MSRPAKVVVGGLVAVAVVWLLFTIVFPWVDRTLITDPTLDTAPAPAELQALAPAAA